MKNELSIEKFALTCDITRRNGKALYNSDITITVALPPNYNLGKKNYPVCYVLDGSKALSKEDDSSGIQKLYSQQLCSAPEVIYVGIDAPDKEAVRTSAYGAPYNTTLFLSNTARSERFYLEGAGDYFLDWIANVVKPETDRRYRTLAEADYCGIIGFSSGGTLALLGGILRPDIFTRVGAFSPSTWAWSNWFYGALANAGRHYDYLDETGDRRIYTPQPGCISRMFIYQGGKDGSAGNDSWAAGDVRNIYDLLIESGAGHNGREFAFNAEGIHSYSAWQKHISACLNVLFPDFI